MKQVSSWFKSETSDPAADYNFEPELIDLAFQDMEQHAGMHRSIPEWSPRAKDPATGDTAAEDRRVSFERMMDYWIGSGQQPPITAEPLLRHLPFLKTFDSLNLVPNYFTETGALRPSIRNLLNVDLRTIKDLNFINCYFPREQTSATVLEVGGGYGRLAEAMFSVFGAEQIRYVLVDAVPFSLLYANAYLKKNCPKLRVGSFYHQDAFDLEQFEVYIVPTWHFEALNRYRYNLITSIQSFQEMAQHHVDYYLSLFDRIASDNALIYLENARDHLFKGEWNYPNSWFCVFRSNTPLSWTRNQPTDVFYKTSEDHSCTNALTEFSHRRMVETQADLERLAATPQAGPQVIMKKVARKVKRLFS